jgi:hypothetical protein
MQQTDKIIRILFKIYYPMCVNSRNLVFYFQFITMMMFFFEYTSLKPLNAQTKFIHPLFFTYKSLFLQVL